MDSLPLPEQDSAPHKMIAAMSKVRGLKRRADSLLEELFRAIFEEIDTNKLRKEIDELRASAPSYTAAEHARLLARRTAMRCAAAGAVTGLPVGGIALGAIGADLAYLMYQQFKMILGIATIYGHEPSHRERFTEALSCLAYSSGVGISKQGIASFLGSASVEGGAVAERIGARMARERIGRLVPFVGALSGGALNYFSVHAVARSAMNYYDTRVEEDLADEIWAEGDREHA